jgi:hypothetical protein
VNAPDDLQRDLPPESASKAQIAKDAERARRHVARNYPDDPKTGKSLWDALGIGKDKK